VAANQSLETDVIPSGRLRAVAKNLDVRRKELDIQHSFWAGDKHKFKFLRGMTARKGVSLDFHLLSDFELGLKSIRSEEHVLD